MSEELEVEKLSLREQLELWQGLVNHACWKLLQRYAEEQQAARLSGILNGLDSVREEDKQRGEYLGIGLFAQYPTVLIETLQVQLDNNSQENEDERQ